ncbi:hypothetical protein KABACHOK_01710 [Brevundimonas phage vB_BpoS-Kabachok]|uniref:Uncharacterized protein n=1 Tax=Brevundimonas phage vB_BpoS-Kabachok TaxID=2948600 RepID=A0A9E7SLP9_9CAUD|nr:hypothetical protein KABACHOK_01710 [Brevundimonas phage vB_BpoS-Kabachok]
MTDSYVTSLPSDEALAQGFDRLPPDEQAARLALADTYIAAHYRFYGEPAMAHTLHDLAEVENEADLMGRIVRALSDAGITLPVVNPEFEVETVTIMAINLVTVDGQTFTIGIDSL